MKSLVTFKARVIYAAIVLSVAIPLSFLGTVVYVSQVDQRRERQGQEFRTAVCALVREMTREYDRIGTDNSRRLAEVWRGLGRLTKCEEA